MIKISNLTKSFGAKILFKDYSVMINNGDFVAFTGASGCGKTTLLNMIGSIEQFDDGKIVIDGLDVRKRKNRIVLFREVYGFLFQNFALVDNKTVEENLSLVLQKYSSGISVDDALEQVGLNNIKKTKVYKLSGGEQQRVALARLLIKKCSVVLADEPTGSLDKKNALRVMELLQSLNKASKTIVMATHDEEMLKFANKVIQI